MSSDHDQPDADKRELAKSATDSADAAGTADAAAVEAGIDAVAADSDAAGSVAGLGAAPVAETRPASDAVTSGVAGAAAAPVTETGAASAGESAAESASEGSGAGSAAPATGAASADASAAESAAAGSVAGLGAAPVADARVVESGGEPSTGSVAGLAAGPSADSAAESTVIDAGAQFAAAASGSADRTPAVEENDSAATPSESNATPREARLHDGGTAPVETIVHVLRHGEVHNPNGILYGRLPGFSLSVAGRSQAGAVARALAEHDIAVVIASPLQRAQETAEPIAAQHHLLVRTDENLIEAGNTFEGLRVSVGDGALRKPRHWWKLRDPFTPSWGEPYLQIAHRMLAAVNKARVEAAGREAVLVSHQLPVWTLRRFLQGQRLWHDPRQRQCSLASLTSLVYQGDTLVDIVYSEPAGGSDPSVHGA
ncbi:Phosphoglycerate mutase [Nocardia ninae]|uniref:Phosphoglycerate mutase n=1 Tax=Nocardia ninae NBRC 108245 TaxID=1210091 RepID=A0A511MTY3_9NOCA|nr:hypothetical protein NN4_85530 [Nocardia ninae NBRC 108245]